MIRVHVYMIVYTDLVKQLYPAIPLYIFISSICPWYDNLSRKVPAVSIVNDF